MRKWVHILLSGTILGLVSGALLFLVFLYIDEMTNINLVHLLLNVDFIYNEPLPLWVELVFHLIISIIIGIIFKLIYTSYFYVHLIAHVFSAFVFVCLYFLLIYLSIEPINMEMTMGLTLWMIFHIGYLQFIHFVLIYRIDQRILRI